jgi:hypothetical protein
MSPLPTLVHIIVEGSTLSLSSPFDITKLQKIVLTSHWLAAFPSQCQWKRIFIALTTTMAMYLNLDLKGIERVIIHISVPENYGFDTIDYFYRSPFPTFTGARGAHKRHQGFIYSYHRVQNSYQLFPKPWIDINVGGVN